MLKAILFDLDQTILDRTTSLIRFIEWQVNYYQLVPQKNKKAFIKRFIKLDNNGSVWKDLVYAQLIKEFHIEKFDVNDLLNSYISDFNKFSVAFEHVPEIIQNLYQQGYKLGLISNGKSPFQENNFHALGLTEFFSTIIVSEAIGLRKPDPRIFKYASDELGCSPNECIFVGDNPKADIEGAKKVGMRTIFFHPNTSMSYSLTDSQIHHYDELKTTIDYLNNLI